MSHEQTQSGRSSNDMAIERTDPAEDRTGLAYERSRLASDRTTMAYMRTSVSLIGFGFTIYKFFQYLRETPGFEQVPSVGPRNLGFALLLLGALMLAMAVVQQIVFLRRLARQAGTTFPVSIALVSSIIMLAIGILALANIILHAGPF